MVIITMVLWVEHMQLSLPFLLPSRLLAFVCFILDLHEGSVSAATPATEHCWLFMLVGEVRADDVQDLLCRETVLGIDLIDVGFHGKEKGIHKFQYLGIAWPIAGLRRVPDRRLFALIDGILVCICFRNCSTASGSSGRYFLYVMARQLILTFDITKGSSGSSVYTSVESW